MPSQAKTRRDPQKGKKGFSTNKGFTLIELMIVVGVLAVIMSLAFPSYRNLIEKRQVTGTAEQLAAFLSSAKMEAVKRNKNVLLQKANDQSCMGFVTYAINDSPNSVSCDCTVTDASADGACSVVNLDDGGPELRRMDVSGLASRLKVTVDEVNIGANAGDDVAIDGLRGLLTVNGVAETTPPIEIKLTSLNDKYAMNVLVSATGRVTLCSDNARAEYPVPGYAECEGGD